MYREERARLRKSGVDVPKKVKELVKEISKKLKIKHWQVLQDLIPPGGGEIAKNLSRTP